MTMKRPAFEELIKPPASETRGVIIISAIFFATTSSDARVCIPCSLTGLTFKYLPWSSSCVITLTGGAAGILFPVESPFGLHWTTVKHFAIMLEKVAPPHFEMYQNTGWSVGTRGSHTFATLLYIGGRATEEVSYDPCSLRCSWSSTLNFSSSLRFPEFKMVFNPISKRNPDANKYLFIACKRFSCKSVNAIEVNL